MSSLLSCTIPYSRGHFTPMFVCIVALSLLSASAVGDEPDQGLMFPSGGVVLKGVPNIPNELLIALAVNGQPFWQSTSIESSRTLGGILDDVCGNQPLSVQPIINGLAEEYNSMGLDDMVYPGLSVAVPFCLRVDPSKQVTVSSDESLLSVLSKNNHLRSEREVRRFCELNPKYCSDIDLDTLSRPLFEGDIVQLPFDSVERTFIPNPDSHFQLTFDSTSRQLGPEEVFAVSQLKEGLRVATEDDFENADILHLSDAKRVQEQTEGERSRVSGAPKAACTTANPGAGLQPFDLRELLDGINQEEILIGEDKQFLSPAVIGLIDTGMAPLERGANAFFKKEFFDEITKEMTSHNDDWPVNGYSDDVYGMRLSKYETGPSVNKFWDASIGHYTPSRNPDNKAEHGTLMASLALGGVDYVRWLSRPKSEESPKVKLRVVNFGCGDNSTCGVMRPQNEIHKAFNYLSDRADIINLSVSSRQAGNRFLTDIGENKGQLFVIAAGNDSQFSLTSPRPVYPAAYNNFQLNNMLVVAASDSAGKPIFISNTDEQRVDILALGCKVRARGFKSAIVGDSDISVIKGTSVSAAIASFTAALVKHLWNDEFVRAWEIKHRVIASIDYDPALAKFARFSGVLNPAKAISLRQNIILTNTNTNPIFMGGKLVVSNGGELAALCKLDTALEINLANHHNAADSSIKTAISNAVIGRRLLKVIPNIPTDNPNQPAIAFWYTNQDTANTPGIEQVVCYQNDGVLNSTESGHSGIPISTIKDIVIKSL